MLQTGISRDNSRFPGAFLAETFASFRLPSFLGYCFRTGELERPIVELAVANADAADVAQDHRMAVVAAGDEVYISERQVSEVVRPCSSQP
jgi:hypothetical protein